MTKTLTKPDIDNATPRDRRFIIWDGSLPGFGIRIEPSGRKAFFLRYRADGGGRSAAQKTLTVGQYGVLTLHEARKQARQTLASVATGHDPASELKSKRREMRVCDLIELYEKEGCYIQRGKHQGQPMKPLSKKYLISRLRNHVVPLLGSKRVSEVNAGDIEKFVRDVAAGKTSKDEKAGLRTRIIVRGGEGAARKVVRDLSAVFSFAIRRELMESNPVMRASVRKTDNERKRFLTVEELQTLGRAFRELVDEGANPKSIKIAKLWALTGCRRNEIAGLKWNEVDLENGLLILDDSKTGKSVRPLSVPAIAVLSEVERDPDSDYVFPAERGEGFFQGTKGIWAKAKEMSGLHDVTPHTLRHTIGSISVSSGEGMELTGALLGHANPRSTAKYAHIQHRPMKQTSERVAAKAATAWEN